MAPRRYNKECLLSSVFLDFVNQTGWHKSSGPADLGALIQTDTQIVLECRSTITDLRVRVVSDRVDENGQRRLVVADERYKIVALLDAGLQCLNNHIIRLVRFDIAACLGPAKSSAELPEYEFGLIIHEFELIGPAKSAHPFNPTEVRSRANIKHFIRQFDDWRRSRRCTTLGSGAGIGNMDSQIPSQLPLATQPPLSGHSSNDLNSNSLDQTQQSTEPDQSSVGHEQSASDAPPMALRAANTQQDVMDHWANLQKTGLRKRDMYISRAQEEKMQWATHEVTDREPALPQRDLDLMVEYADNADDFIDLTAQNALADTKEGENEDSSEDEPADPVAYAQRLKTRKDAPDEAVPELPWPPTDPAGSLTPEPTSSVHVSTNTNLHDDASDEDDDSLDEDPSDDEALPPDSSPQMPPQTFRSQVAHTVRRPTMLDDPDEEMGDTIDEVARARAASPDVPAFPLSTQDSGTSKDDIADDRQMSSPPRLSSFVGKTQRSSAELPDQARQSPTERSHDALSNLSTKPSQRSSSQRGSADFAMEVAATPITHADLGLASTNRTNGADHVTETPWPNNRTRFVPSSQPAHSIANTTMLPPATLPRVSMPDLPSSSASSSDSQMSQVSQRRSTTNAEPSSIQRRRDLPDEVDTRSDGSLSEGILKRKDSDQPAGQVVAKKARYLKPAIEQYEPSQGLAEYAGSQYAINKHRQAHFAQFNAESREGPRRGPAQKPATQDGSGNEQGAADNMEIDDSAEVQVNESPELTRMERPSGDPTTNFTSLRKPVPQPSSPVGSSDLFTSFKRAYDNWAGNETVFTKMLTKLSRTHVPKKFRDDFVIRYDEYKQHIQDCIDDCDDVPRYEDWFDEECEGPMNKEGVLNRLDVSKTLSRLVATEASGQKRQTPASAMSDSSRSGLVRHEHTEVSPPAPRRESLPWVPGATPTTPVESLKHLKPRLISSVHSNSTIARGHNAHSPIQIDDEPASKPKRAAAVSISGPDSIARVNQRNAQMRHETPLSTGQRTSTPRTKRKEIVMSDKPMTKALLDYKSVPGTSSFAKFKRKST